MSILRVATGPADVGVAGFTFVTAAAAMYDVTRVAGAFRFIGTGQVLTIDNNAPAGTTVWYHFRYAQDSSANRGAATVFTIADVSGNALATMNLVAGYPRISAVGDTTVNSPTQLLADNVAYSVDIQVIVAPAITARLYINGALYGEVTAANSTKGVARRAIMQGGNNLTFHFSEYVVADEDTRGMRIREMRPTAFGIFQEWDGSANSVRDDDLATGISTATANRRVSFGVTNLENINPSDVVNRVVMQSFAQRGESGLTRFNHFFRFRGGAVEDGANQTLAVTGQRFTEEFLVNPDTGLAWEPEDFRSLQIGVRSLA